MWGYYHIIQRKSWSRSDQGQQEILGSLLEQTWSSFLWRNQNPAWYQRQHQKQRSLEGAFPLHWLGVLLLNLRCRRRWCSSSSEKVRKCLWCPVQRAWMDSNRQERKCQRLEETTQNRYWEKWSSSDRCRVPAAILIEVLRWAQKVHHKRTQLPKSVHQKENPNQPERRHVRSIENCNSNEH